MNISFRKSLDISLSRELQQVTKVASLFFACNLLLLLYRHYSLYASYDQGIFNQIFWNTLHGGLFESSLSSALSGKVLHQSDIPTVSYRHLGQHFNPIFLLWLPIYALFPFPITLSILQVVLLTAAGLVLYRLARQHLAPNLSVMIVFSFYGANAVIGPTLGNFHDYCPLPLLIFSLLLAFEKRWWRSFWAIAILVLAVREDAGVALLSIGAYSIFSRRHRQIGIALCLLSTAYILLVTNCIMPLFSTDISQRLVVERFGQYTGGKPTSTLEAIWALLTHPGQVLLELTSRPQKLSYLIGHWLPLAFVPLISADAWITAGLPLLQLLLMKGEMVLSINIRYATLAVPGLFYGAILWWSKHPKAFQRKFQKYWMACIGLSLLLTLVSNPNRTLSFLIPDSLHPWVYVPLTQQVQHTEQARTVIAQIPHGASVTATTYLIPPLSSRRAIVRFPNSISFWNDAQQLEKVDYIVADLWQFQQYQPAFKADRHALQESLSVIDQTVQTREYSIQNFRDGVILLHHAGEANSSAAANWMSFRQSLLAHK